MARGEARALLGDVTAPQDRPGLARAGPLADGQESLDAVAHEALEIMPIEARSRTMALPVELDRHWFYSVPLFASLASMAFTGCYLVAAELAKALTGRPVEAELEVARRREAEEREAAP